jgi:hypothetical protein
MIKKGEVMKEDKKVAVLITTDNTKRGVFMGLIDPKDADKETLVADEVRMAVYWHSDVRGVLGRFIRSTYIRFSLSCNP